MTRNPQRRSAAAVNARHRPHVLWPTGTQGDPWDAHKDMALAAAGAIIALTVTALINWKYQRDFTREWTDSLRIHPPQDYQN